MTRTTVALTLLLLTSALAGARKTARGTICTVEYQDGELDLSLITGSGCMASVHGSFNSLSGFTVAVTSGTSDETVNFAVANLSRSHPVLLPRTAKTWTGS